ncbi:MAG: signal peptidase I, partial [Planctomycetota bacterium]
MPKTNAHPRLAAAWSQWFRPLLLILLVVGGVRSAIADWHDVPTQSMEPTILAGDRIVVNKLAYDLRVPLLGWSLASWSDPDRGDVITCFSPEDGTRLVKRIVAVPGDRVAMRHGRLVINGEPVPMRAEAPVVRDLSDPGPARIARERLGDRDHAVMLRPGRSSARSFPEMLIPDGQYLVLGDNRDNSRDSRSFGLVPRDAIAGRVFGVAFSLDPDRSLAPRGDRFAI